jgi:hypothetical protein
MDPMNPAIASVYGTGGHEKVASTDGKAFNTLSDIAMVLVTEGLPEGTEIEKVAAAHDAVLEELQEYDMAGRAAAHAEFSEMEKAAFEGGDSSALEQFLGEAVQEPVSEADRLRQAVAEELARRAAR